MTKQTWKIWFSAIKDKTHLKHALIAAPHAALLRFVAQRVKRVERPETETRLSYTVEETSPIEDAFDVCLLDATREDSKTSWKLLEILKHSCRNYAMTEYLPDDLYVEFKDYITQWWHKLNKDKKPHEITKLLKDATTVNLKLSNIGYVETEIKPKHLTKHV